MAVYTHDRSDTQLIATIGPASGAREKLGRMIAGGMDAARLDGSSDDYGHYDSFISAVRDEARAARSTVPIILDLPGPGIRDGASRRVAEGPIITERDLAHIEYGIKNHIEYFALSCVGCAEDVERLRTILHGRTKARIIARIERVAALQDIQAILRVADAIMIARGDLGIEIPLETIPFVQADLIKAARRAKRPVIVATEMLTSMVAQDTPSRADVTDIVTAVMQGADAVMLSNETATGDYPIEAVEMMEKTLLEAERHIAIARNTL